MIQLEFENVIIRELLTEKANKPGSVDQQFVDFDGVRYHICTPEKKTELLLSMDLRCWSDLVQYGAEEVMAREYGPYITATEPDYSVSLLIKLEQLPQDPEARAQLIQSFALIRRNALSAPFERAFDIQKELEKIPVEQGEPVTPPQIMAIRYRPEEAIYVVPGADRVTVVFSTVFKEETDRIFGKVFLQEFADARKLPAIQAAPQVLYSLREPPLEIRSVPSLSTAENVGYVTFVLFPRHFNSPDRRWQTISRLMQFRDYLHYHIKCSKAYMHSRLRHRVAEFLKILNRAKPDAEKERKTATGRTFGR